MSSRHSRHRNAARANDSLLGGTKSRFAHALFSRAAYSGCGIPDSSADHSFRHERFAMVRPNALARMMAVSMLLLRGLAKTDEGGSAGHARLRARIWFSPRSESGARSKFDVYGGRTNSPGGTRTEGAGLRESPPVRHRSRRAPPPPPNPPPPQSVRPPRSRCVRP